MYIKIGFSFEASKKAKPPCIHHFMAVNVVCLTFY
jgi:hypothetical protein